MMNPRKVVLAGKMKEIPDEAQRKIVGGAHTWNHGSQGEEGRARAGEHISDQGNSHWPFWTLSP